MHYSLRMLSLNMILSSVIARYLVFFLLGFWAMFGLHWSEEAFSGIINAVFSSIHQQPVDQTFSLSQTIASQPLVSLTHQEPNFYQ